MLTFLESQGAALVALYRLIQESDQEEYFTSEEIKQRAGAEIGAASIQRGLRHLRNDELVAFKSGQKVKFSLNGRGFDSAEEIITKHPDIVPIYIPASDRIVSLGHNGPIYSDIQKSLERLCEEVRVWNGNPDGPEDRFRILASVEAARALWTSNELRLIQIKVGVIMAIEDAQTAFGKLIKTVGNALLIEAIKSVVKAHSPFDLDHI